MESESLLSSTEITLEQAQKDYVHYKSLIESYQQKIYDLDHTIHHAKNQITNLNNSIKIILQQEQDTKQVLETLKKQRNNAKIIWTGIQKSLNESLQENNAS